MYLRLRLSLLTLALVCFASCIPLVAGPQEDAEAQRMYSWADAYVRNVTEGDYSYAYIQFYWKRAQSYMERIQRLYPNTPTGKALAAGQLKLGGFDLKYFRERVLYRLEEKRVAAFDGVDCAIFLYNLSPNRWDEPRHEALGRILENLSRQKRFSEALKFPVLDKDRVFKQETVFTVAARYEQDDIVKQLLTVTPKAELPRMHAILGEALALRGRPRASIEALLKQDPSEVVKLAVLNGMVLRETAIRRAAALKMSPDKTFLLGDTLKRLEVRDDVMATAKSLFPGGNPQADSLLAKYRAGLGEMPAADEPAETHSAYLDYLALSERFDDLASYAQRTGLSSETRNACILREIQLLAEAARTEDAGRLLSAYAAGGPEASDRANLALFRGEMDSRVEQLIVHSNTFSGLPIKDPCLLAEAIMEWTLTPNRALRGSSAWDSVVHEFEPGFDNIPESTSKTVSAASGATNPY